MARPGSAPRSRSPPRYVPRPSASVPIASRSGRSPDTKNAGAAVVESTHTIADPGDPERERAPTGYCRQAARTPPRRRAPPPDASLLPRRRPVSRSLRPSKPRCPDLLTGPPVAAPERCQSSSRGPEADTACSPGGALTMTAGPAARPGHRGRSSSASAGTGGTRRTCAARAPGESPDRPRAPRPPSGDILAPSGPPGGRRPGAGPGPAPGSSRPRSTHRGAGDQQTSPPPSRSACFADQVISWRQCGANPVLAPDGGRSAVRRRFVGTPPGPSGRPERRSGLPAEVCPGSCALARAST